MGIAQPPEDGSHTNFLEEYQRSPITRKTDGSFSTRFPWKEAHTPLLSNYAMCERRTRSMLVALAIHRNFSRHMEDSTMNMDAEESLREWNSPGPQTPSVKGIIYYPL